jgi:hypothetical protein
MNSYSHETRADGVNAAVASLPNNTGGQPPKIAQNMCCENGIDALV